MNAVTGVGPRTGTSWTMLQLKKAGLPINGHQFIDDLMVRKHNPDGYWDLDPREPMPQGGISKIWGVWQYPMLHKVVVLQRLDEHKQIDSIAKVMADERLLPAYADFPELCPRKLLEYCKEQTKAWLETRDYKNTKIVYTESLLDEIGSIIDFLKEKN